MTLHDFCFAPPQGTIFCVLPSQAGELEVIPQDLTSGLSWPATGPTSTNIQGTNPSNPWCAPLDRAKPSKTLPSEGNIQISNAEPQMEVLSVDDISRFYGTHSTEHCPLIPQKPIQIRLFQRPTLTCIKHCTPDTTAVNSATCM